MAPISRVETPFTLNVLGYSGIVNLVMVLDTRSHPSSVDVGFSVKSFATAKY